MILAIDVHYKENIAKIVAILFNWQDETPQNIIVEQIASIEEYISGEFYKRELPCIESILKKVNLDEIKTIIIDGHVYVDNNREFGLGGYTWESLSKEISVIGVAKSSFFRNKNTVKEVFRGESKKPLYVSSIGINLDIAASFIKNMHGAFRIPTLLKELDRITKE
ncbi:MULTISPECIES: endonuclease V [unclassified Flavobacterium]|uniref:endonuclease V n=1 Tax=unclassified Flavobacterium TaxID=196869 RepID=UPI000F0C00E3|nr:MULTISPECIES: endonuclease V [unclassified Flavobacterium]AYN03369.1 endonuclease V [Flavobacterium sp. 140616W15]MCD0476050.1 endonuclease V [Flavobacterium sp. EDS]